MSDIERQGVPTATRTGCGVGCGCDVEDVALKPLPMHKPFAKAAYELPEASPKQAFNLAADATFAEAQAIHGQRGTEYSDSWALGNVHAPVLKMSLREIFGFDPTPEELRVIMAASLVDVKDSRYLGGWKKDTALDGLNYRAAHAAWLTEYLDAKP